MRTPSQTVGPFFGFALPWPDGPFVVPAGTRNAVWLQGRVTDGAGDPVPDALIETWQADPEGRFPRDAAAAAPGFRGFGRCPTDVDGRYAILTLVPGPTPGLDGHAQAPHVDMAIFARGLLKQVVTRVYFPDEPANVEDPVLSAVADPARRATLVAERTEDGFRFDIRLQGERETIFFEL